MSLRGLEGGGRIPQMGTRAASVGTVGPFASTITLGFMEFLCAEVGTKNSEGKRQTSSKARKERIDILYRTRARFA
jgi:hypothetical protein